ncbi:MAG: septation protein IspZ [Caulobacteraceae bacterium]|nr:septation protein IspZ [Caulobacteraceae bacterium]
MADRRRAPVWLRYLVDGAPAVVFLAVLLVTRDFRLATWFVVGGSALGLAANLVAERRIAPLPAITGGLALAFGTASLLLHRHDILQMKMTIVDGLLGAALFGGLTIGRNPLKLMLGGAFELPDAAWRTLAVRYGLFWWACAVANEIVRRTMSEAHWAIFRTGVMIGAVAFALAQTPFLIKHARDKNAQPPDPPEMGL